jgi:hypothetical protein
VAVSFIPGGNRSTRITPPDQTVVTGNTIDGGQEVMIDIKIVTREETGIRKNYL